MTIDPERVRRAAEQSISGSVSGDLWVTSENREGIVAAILEASGYPADLDRAVSALTALVGVARSDDRGIGFANAVAVARAVLRQP